LGPRNASTEKNITLNWLADENPIHGKSSHYVASLVQVRESHIACPVTFSRNQHSIASRVPSPHSPGRRAPVEGSFVLVNCQYTCLRRESLALVSPSQCNTHLATRKCHLFAKSTGASSPKVFRRDLRRIIPPRVCKHPPQLHHLLQRSIAANGVTLVLRAQSCHEPRAPELSSTAAPEKRSVNRAGISISFI
jgi:hypothetical protein